MVHLLDGPDVDAGRLHVEHEVRDALVRLRVRVGAREQDPVAGELRERRPHLLPVDHVLVAVAHRRRRERREVAARLRLAEELAPDLGAVEQAGQVARLLLGRCRRRAASARPSRSRSGSSASARTPRFSSSSITSCSIGDASRPQGAGQCGATYPSRRAAGSSRAGTRPSGACSARNARISAAVRLGLGGQLERQGHGMARRHEWDNPAVAPSGGALGVYVHIPFCADRCDYCDFATWTDRGHLIDDYVDACVADVDTRDGREHRRRATSVFFGGGTPSLLPAAGLARILAAIDRDRRRRGHRRVQPRLRRPEQLDTLRGRGREPALVRRAVDAAARARRRSAAPTIPPTSSARCAAARDAGFEHVNLDLIYGTPGESVDDWRAHARRRARARPGPRQRVRAHRRARHRRSAATSPRADEPAPDDDDQADEVRDRRRRPHRRRATSGTRSRTGPGPGGSAATTSSTGSRATTSRSAAPRTATSTVAGGGTCARPSATSPRSRPARPPRPATRCSTPRRATEEAMLARAPDPRPASRSTPRARRGRRGARRPTASSSAAADRVVLTRRGRLLASDVTVRLPRRRSTPDVPRLGAVPGSSR